MVTRFDKNTPDIGRLCEAMHKDRLVLRRTRENRRNMVRQLVGRHWSEQGTAEPVLANLIAKYQSVVGRSLIAKNPRVKLGTFDRGAKPTVAKMEAWVNREIERIALVEELQAVVLDSLFSIGVMKVALAAPADAAKAGWGVRAGQPFAEPVDPDDLVFDTHSRHLHRLGYVGHRIRVPLDSVRDSTAYSSARKDLAASEDSQFNAEGDERISVLFRGYYSSREEYEDFVDLWEVYLPRERVVLTLADSQIVGAVGSKGRDRVKPLAEKEWVGPDSGPFHFLAMMKVPGNVWPKAPIQDVYDLHLVVNNIYRKLARQAERFKDVYAATGGRVEDAERHRQASDGEMIRCDGKPELIPGVAPNQGIFTLGQYFDGVFNREAGNLDLLSGAAAPSRTAKQDTMLNENANRVLGEMQDRTMDHVVSVVKALLWFWQYHPTAEMRVEHTYPGVSGVGLVRKATPEQRRAIKPDTLDVRVDPYSLTHKTPEERLARIQAVVRQEIIPALPVMAQQGIKFDWNAYMTLQSEYMDEPRLADLLTFQPPPDTGGDPTAGGGPANTTREYVRRSVGQPPQGEKPAQQIKQGQMNGPLTPGVL